MSPVSWGRGKPRDRPEKAGQEVVPVERSPTMSFPLLANRQGWKGERR